MISTPVHVYNEKVIDEFRGNEGRVSGIWEGAPLLLLYHTGAKSGASRVNPVGYLADKARYLILASNGRAPGKHAWYFNLMAHPSTSIEVGRESIDVVAREAAGEERERLFQRGAERFPDLAKHARKTDRDTAAIVLTPLGNA